MHTFYEGRHRLVRLKKLYTLDVSPDEAKYRIVCDIEIQSKMDKKDKKVYFFFNFDFEF